jgi:Uma2 family endonuclease
LPALPDAAFLATAPDWACEVISRSTEAIDRGKKLAIYAREGIAHLWLVNPVSETLEVYALSQGKWMLSAPFVGAASVRAEPFEAIELELGPLWDTGPASVSPEADPR